MRQRPRERSRGLFSLRNNRGHTITPMLPLRHWRQEGVLHFVLHSFVKRPDFLKNHRHIPKIIPWKKPDNTRGSAKLPASSGKIKNAPDRNRTYARGSGGHCSIHWATGASAIILLYFSEFFKSFFHLFISAPGFSLENDHFLAALSCFLGDSLLKCTEVRQ